MLRETSRVLAVAGGAALALLVSLTATPAQANPYHVSVRGGGGVVVNRGPAGVVRGGRPGYYPGGGYYRPRTIVPRTRIWTRPHAYYPGRRTYWNPYFYSYGYYYPYPAYAYDYGYGYGYYAPAPPPPAPVVGVVAAPEPREPSIGVGVRGSAVRAGSDHPAAEGIGALLRFRQRPVEVELEVGWDRYGSETHRNDTRVAASLYVPLFGHAIQPYLVASAGMNFARFDDSGDTLHQGFLAGGGGLALNLGRSFTIAADARYMVREFFDDDARIAANPVSLAPGVVDKHDEAVEFRANAILYF